MTQARHMDRGILFTAIAAAVAVGSAASTPFATPKKSTQDPEATINYIVKGAAWVAPTTFTFQVQISDDGGSTWANFGAAVNGVTTPIGTISGIPEGVLAQLIVASLVLGPATNVSVELST